MFAVVCVVCDLFAICLRANRPIWKPKFQKLMFYAQVGSARCDACDWLVLVVLPPTSEGGGGYNKANKIIKTVLEK